MYQHRPMLIEVSVRAHLKKWGNSMAIRLPKAFVRQLGLRQQVEIEMVLDKDKIVLRKPKYELADLLKHVDANNIHPES